jgi:hypothetical protein
MNGMYSGTETGVFTRTLFYETIESHGPGTPYTGPDNVPRFRFTGPVTGLDSKTVTVRQAFSSAWIASSDKSFTAPEYSLPPRPTCKLSREFCDLWSARYYLYPIDLINNDLSDLGVMNPFEACNEARNCHVDVGDEVLLIYWRTSLKNENPPLTAHSFNRFPVQNWTETSLTTETARTITTNALTFHGQDLYFRGSIQGNITHFPTSDVSYVSSSIMNGNFTFVSPNVYVAHHRIRGIVSVWGTEGSTSYSTILLRTPGILTLQSADVSSYLPDKFDFGTIPSSKYVQDILQGKFDLQWPEPLPLNQGPPDWLKTAQFNFSNLEEPVPANEYFDARYEDCYYHQTHCRTITEGSYRPRLALPKEIWLSMFPQDFYCKQAMLVDPPIALQPIITEGLFAEPDTSHITPVPQGPQATAVEARPREQASKPYPSMTVLVPGLIWQTDIFDSNSGREGNGGSDSKISNAGKKPEENDSFEDSEGQEGSPNQTRRPKKQPGREFGTAEESIEPAEEPGTQMFDSDCTESAATCTADGDFEQHNRGARIPLVSQGVASACSRTSSAAILISLIWAFFAL